MPVLLAVAAAVVWGGSDFLAGVLSRRMPAVVVIAWSQAVGLVAISLVLLVRAQGLPPAGPWVGWSVLAAVTGSAGLLCFYAALASGTMGVVAPVAAMGAGVPVLLGVLTGDAPGVWSWAGIAVALVGVVLASGPELTGGSGARPVLLAVGAAGCFGFALFALDRGARGSLLETLWLMRLTSVIGWVMVAAVARSLGQVGRGELPGLAVVGIGDLGANTLFSVATVLGMVSVVSVLASLYPVVTILLARQVLRERLRRVQQVGVAVAMLGIGLIAAGGGH